MLDSNERGRIISELENVRNTIQFEIDNLKKITKNNLHPLWIDDEEYKIKHERIGFCNIDRIRVILKALFDGNTLRLISDCIGIYEVKLNPQQNRLIVDRVCSKNLLNPISEFNIFPYIMWNPGDWFIVS